LQHRCFRITSVASKSKPRRSHAPQQNLTPPPSISGGQNLVPRWTRSTKRWTPSPLALG
jgi:hypothetical protein